MKQYIVDAFTDRVFSGNPRAVCVMDSWPDVELMKSIARENNLSETAFTVKKDDGLYHLRWFTPGDEVDLCGHATLGTAFVILTYYEPERDSVSFDTLSGRLTVTRKGDLFEMDFPSYDLKEVPVTEDMVLATGAVPVKAYMGRDLLCVYDDEEIIRRMEPDQDAIMKLDGLLLHVTAKGKDYDCVSRSFAPKLAIAEDPVCGSGHCHIVPYWSRTLGRKDVTAYQASRRGGVLYCSDEGDRIILRGKVAPYSQSELFI